MKIAILTPVFPAEHLPGLAVYNIAKNLAKKHEVHVITSLDKSLPKSSAEDGIYVHAFKTPKIPILRTFFYYMKSFTAIKKIALDIVNVQTIFLAPSGLLAKKFLHTPYIVYGRGSDVYLPWRFKNLISKPMIKHADSVIALTEDMKGAIQRIYDREVFVIPNGINLERFECLSKERMRKRLHIRDDENICIFVGSLRPVKGVRYLIEAMKIIADKNTNTRLFIVGDGEERKFLENRSRDLNIVQYINFVGQVPNEEVPWYMVSADIFILPSLSEGFPVAVLEAMASGLPVITTNLRALHEFVNDGENGLLAEPKNPEQIADKILMLLEDDELRVRMSKKNKEVVEKYSWEVIVGRLEGVYKDAILNYEEKKCNRS